MDNKTGRFFNTAGPIVQGDHYSIDPLSRFNLDEMLALIAQKKYFVLHAPRQTGKTSYLFALMEYLNNGAQYTCLYINVESAQAARSDVEKGMYSVLSRLASDALNFLNDSFLKTNIERIFKESGPFNAFQDALTQWCKHSSKPIILFIDEVDSLVGDTLISLLRQLRGGYTMRPAMFPQSVILCGVRDVKDYRLHSILENDIITGGSAFNVKAESLRLGRFTPDEVRELYAQHTKETGQAFREEVFPLVWELTEGQPWLVNALAYETCFRMKEGRDRSVIITDDIIRQAAENLILRRETHLDQLADKLKEDRVHSVIAPILSGSPLAGSIPENDIEYVIDLGLVIRDGGLRIANGIYKEVIPRQLIHATQDTITHKTEWYVDDDGRLNMDKLFTAFQDFFREHFQHWQDGFQYAEAGAQLFLQAFLQRIVNGGGRVHREYALNRERTDLMVEWNHKNGKQRVVIELKIRRGALETTINKGLSQTWKYMDTCGTDEGYLLVFDRTPDVPAESKIFKQKSAFEGKEIIVFGM